MNKINNAKLLAATVRLLSDALETARNGNDPAFQLVEALAPLHLHQQRQHFEDARLNNSRNAGAYSAEQIADAIALLDDWLERLNSANVERARYAAQTLRMHYGSFNLLKKLESLEAIRKKRLEN